MDRLTKPAIGCFAYDLKDHKRESGEFSTYDAFYNYHIAVKRLGEYEDTGLTPEEVKRLAEAKVIYEAYDGSKLDKADQYIERLEAEKEVYRKHWIDLFDKILAEIDKDGWCRICYTRKQALEQRKIFEEFK